MNIKEFTRLFSRLPLLRRFAVPLALAAIVLLYAAVNYPLNKAYYYFPLHADESIHLVAAHTYSNFFKSFPHSLDQIPALLRFVYPPLYYVTAALFNMGAPFSKAGIIRVNLFFLLMLLVSMYFIGKKAGGTKGAGLLAAFVIAMFPMVSGMSNFCMLDFPLTAVTALSICCLLYSEGFARRNASLLFGFTAALAFLTKWTAGFFIIGPWAYSVFQSGPSLPARRERMKNALLALYITVLFSLIWYVLRFPDVFRGDMTNIRGILRYCEFGRGLMSATRRSGEVPGLLYYLGAIFPYQVSWLFSLIFFPAVYVFLRSRLPHKPFIVFWFLVPLAVFTFIGVKAGRYIMPALAPLALIIALGIINIRSGRLKVFAAGVLVCAGLFQYLFLAYFPAERALQLSKFPGALKKFLYSDLSRYGYYFEDDWLRHYPKGYKEKVENYRDLLDEIAQHKETLAPGRALRVGVIWPGTMWAAGKQRPQAYPAFAAGLDVDMVGFYEDPQTFLENFTKFDVLMLRTFDGDWVERQTILDEFISCNRTGLYQYAEKNLDALEASLKSLREVFVPVQVVKFKDGYYVYVLARNIHGAEKRQVYLTSRSSVEHEGIRLAFNDGRMDIYYKGTAVTKNGGLDAEFYEGGVLYRNSDAIWQVEKRGDNGLRAVASWPSTGMKQSWDFRIGQGCLDLRVEIVSGQGLQLSGVQVQLNLKEGYKEAQHYSGGGTLPGPGISREGLDFPDKLSGLLLIKGFESPESVFPGIGIDLRNGPGTPANLLERLSLHLEETHSLVLISTPFEPVNLPQGRSHLFSGRLSFFESNAGLEQSAQRARAAQEIRRGPLSVFFNDGYSMVSWEGKELTNYPGIYQEASSARASYLSLAGVWEIRKENEHRLVATGKWWDSPLVQVVRIELEDENTIVYNIETQLLRREYLEGEGFVVTLPEAFEEYLVPYSAKTALFPLSSNRESGWEKVWEGQVRHVSALQVFNPSEGISLAVDCSFAPPEYTAIISNTNRQMPSRSLACRRVNESPRLEPGKFLFPTMKVKVVQRRDR
ncbi:MAG: phospholipid carrier-dependent glycosyltransferase [Candidatus Omnitrophica bacterium]|nr:phospholipid carrier-dependent glycosyltransferase [Candidatus Omnitrophota bacterium]